MKTQSLKLRATSRKPIDEHQEQFKKVLQEMITSHAKHQITFNQFISILGKFNVKFYSPEQFKKISKIFNNTFHVLPTHTPFEYLDYYSKQNSASVNYFLVRIMHKKIDIYSNDHRKKMISHPVERCMNDFVIIMKKRYGNQINWFKVLGGMTVSVSIEAEVFRLNLTQIMKNTNHHQCIEQIMNVFLQAKQKRIIWDQFMFVAKTYIKKIKEGVTSRGRIKSLRNNFEDQQKIQPYFTVKSKFFKTTKSQINTSKDTKFQRTNPPSQNWQTDKYFFRSRFRTQAQQQPELKINLHQCPLYSRTNVSVSFTQSSELSYPIKKNTISLPIKQQKEYKRHRNNFLLKYLKGKIQRE